jgi:hypothetical protein
MGKERSGIVIYMGLLKRPKKRSTEVKCVYIWQRTLRDNIVIHSVAIRQVHRLFLREFSTQRNLMLSLSISNILSFL